MSNNPDNNTQVSTQPEGRGAGEQRDRPAVERDPASDLGHLLKKAEDEATELRDAWLRAKAETENARRLAQNDIAKAHKFAIERFAQELLSVKDALELTLATPGATIDTLKDGRALTLKNLSAAFDKARIEEINPLHQKYDPHRHQAMTMIDTDKHPP